MEKIENWFNDFSIWASELIGTYWAFIVAVTIVTVWIISGPIFGFSDTWQLVINTGTTVITFLMLFLVQNTQNRDAKAIHIKLDELILSIKEADNKMIDAEHLPHDQVTDLEQEIIKLAHKPHDVI